MVFPSEVWFRLLRKHVLSKFEGESTAGVAAALRTCEMFWEKPPPQIELPSDTPTLCREIIEWPGKFARAFEARILRAYREKDRAFLIKLEARKVSPHLGVKGLAVLAYRELWLELDNCPHDGQLRKRLDAKLKLRGRLGIGDDQWRRLRRAIAVLPLLKDPSESL